MDKSKSNHQDLGTNDTLGENANKAHLAMSECPYCKPKQVEEKKDSLESCPYCQKVSEDSSAEDSLANCKYCNNEELEESACPYCHSIHERNSGELTQLPTTTDSQNYEGQNLNSPEIEKPVPGEEPPIGLGISMDNPSNNNINTPNQGVSQEKIPKETVQNDHSKDAMQQIAEQILMEETPQQVVQQTDSTDLAVGTSMEDNISRPAGYSSDVPGDMGLGEEQSDEAPNLTSLLTEGLDSQAEAIKREKVIQMVGQALEGFKASKKIIERAQSQAPQLYQSSIMMLKAMIEMANLLGLGQEVNVNPENPLEEPGNAQPSEWENPFPVHPENGGAPQAQNVENQIAPNVPSQGDWNNPFPVHPENGGDGKLGSIGQGVGKLPTSAMTTHVPKIPIEPGSVNAQGQMRYVDPNTGKESFIDMKQGRVLSNTGKPVKG